MIVFITIVNIAGIDANLLIVLHLVLEERSATRAARRLHLTQSAVSNALARLRARLGDRLVVRTGRGLAATPRGERMAPLLARAFAELEAAVGPERFDPASCTRTFKFADSEELSQLPRLSQLFERRLPRATLELGVSEDPIAALVAGRADVAMGPDGLKAPGLYRRLLYQEQAVRVVRRGHPAWRRAARPGSDLPQVAVEVTEAARSRVSPAGGRIAMRVPSFVAAALAASETDLVGTLPLRLARSLAPVLRLRVLATQGRRLPVALYWHARTHGDEAMRFFRALVVEVTRVEAPPRTERRGASAGARSIGRRPVEASVARRPVSD
jgi:DNA-binding transcriptional LysR family regulator